VEPQGSLPGSQEPSTCPYREPDQSSPYHPILSLSKICNCHERTCPMKTAYIPCTKSHISFPYLRSLIQRIRLSTRSFVTFSNKLIFYSEDLLAPRPNPKLEDHHLLAVRDCLFNIVTSTPEAFLGSGSINTFL
jgi:hypothetical protein